MQVMSVIELEIYLPLYLIKLNYIIKSHKVRSVCSTYMDQNLIRPTCLNIVTNNVFNWNPLKSFGYETVLIGSRHLR